MSTKMQDLEEHIMNCWGVVDDIKSYLRSKHLNDDRVMNFLVGLEELYQVKFETLFDTYSEALQEHYAARQTKYDGWRAAINNKYYPTSTQPTWRINNE